jgi:hypothetical protein
LQVQKRAFTAALLTALLASTIAVTLLANPAKANPVAPPPVAPLITVLSPESDQTYASNSIDLTFTVSYYPKPLASSIQYFLDGKMLGQLDDYAPWSF